MVSNLMFIITNLLYLMNRIEVQISWYGGICDDPFVNDLCIFMTINGI